MNTSDHEHIQDPAGNRTTRRPPDHRKETQTAVVWTCLLLIRSGQNHLARHSERGEVDKADRGRGGETTSGNGQAWSSASPRRQWRTGENGGKKKEKKKTGREIICGALTTLAVKGLMMMMMMIGRAHLLHTLARISPQRPSELRRLWPIVFPDLMICV